MCDSLDSDASEATTPSQSLHNSHTTVGTLLLPEYSARSAGSSRERLLVVGVFHSAHVPTGDKGDKGDKGALFVSVGSVV